MKKILFSLLGIAMLWSCGSEKPAPSAHPDWTYNTVVYEMNVRQLTPEGTFAAAERYLPELKAMGVDIVWLMPIHPIGVKERKGTLGSYYAISDYCAVNPEFGTMEDFDSFLAAAHGLGMRVILDWVANHTSPDAKWVDERPADWYVRDEQGNLVVQYDWTDIAKLDYANEDMRAEMRKSMRFWIERGVDGFRCDVAEEVPIDFWRTAFAELREVNPELYFLAEGDDFDDEVAKLHDAFDASYTWALHHLLNDIAQGAKGVAELKEYVAADAQKVPHEAFRLMFTSNHDENSWAGTEFTRMGDAALTMAALTFFLPNGQPLIYTGQEMGYDHSFEFFEKDAIPALENNGFTALYTNLCRIRHENPALAAGERGGEAVWVEGMPESVLAFTRTVEGNTVLCVFNLSAEPAEFTVPAEIAGDYVCAWTGEDYPIVEGDTMPLVAWQWAASIKK